jgi:hypothetical protein
MFPLTRALFNYKSIMMGLRLVSEKTINGISTRTNNAADMRDGSNCHRCVDIGLEILLY